MVTFDFVMQIRIRIPKDINFINAILNSHEKKSSQTKDPATKWWNQTLDELEKWTGKPSIKQK